MPNHFPFGRDDRAPIALIALLPAALALPQILGWIATDPLLYTGELSVGRQMGLLPGVPSIDPNNGFTTQALGARSALEWLSGKVPWWNSYSGVGLPLAAEYQPAAFSPLVFLLLLPNGMAWHQTVLQVIAGLGAFGLLRQLGLVRIAATTGALLYAFNGTLAWFAHGPATVVPWIPWMVWGVERAYLHARSQQAGGWRLFAISLTMALLGGFPETAYIGGLLALAWSIVRALTLPPLRGLAMAQRVFPAGLIGLAITAPQTIAFFQYLAYADIGDHAGFARAGLPWAAAVSSLLAPYFYGPIFGLGNEWNALWGLWGGIGGYVTAAIIVAATFGIVARPTSLNAMLVGWIAIVLGKSFVVDPFVQLLNLIPGVAIAAFARYVQPTWELAFIVLAAVGIDELAQESVRTRRPSIAAAVILIALLAFGFWLTAKTWPHFPAGGQLQTWAIASGIGAAAVALATLALLSVKRHPLVIRAIAVLLVAESVALFHLPSLSSPRGAQVDHAAIQFLKANLGLNRFYTLGPIQPNYGAYFGIASINHNYLPVATRWTKFVRAHLDSGADSTVFNGAYGRPPGIPSQAEELRRKLAAYEWVGVKYVVAYATHPPPFDPEDLRARRVYSDARMAIYELANPKPYFEVVAGTCTIDFKVRDRLTARCEGSATLLRRELFFPGWQATLGGEDVQITEHEKLFQRVELPAGESELRFAYSPPGIGWAWLIAMFGLVTLVVGGKLRSQFPHRLDNS